jgi:hypothetical protein
MSLRSGTGRRYLPLPPLGAQGRLFTSSIVTFFMHLSSSRHFDEDVVRILGYPVKSQRDRYMYRGKYL